MEMRLEFSEKNQTFRVVDFKQDKKQDSFETIIEKCDSDTISKFKHSLEMNRVISFEQMNRSFYEFLACNMV